MSEKNFTQFKKNIPKKLKINVDTYKVNIMGKHNV